MPCELGRSKDLSTSGDAGRRDIPDFFEILIFLFRRYIYALAVLQCQGKAEEPRGLLHNTSSLGQEIIADLNLSVLKRGFLT